MAATRLRQVLPYPAMAALASVTFVVADALNLGRDLSYALAAAVLTPIAVGLVAWGTGLEKPTRANQGQPGMPDRVDDVPGALESGRASVGTVILQIALLGAAGFVGVALASDANWDPELIGVLLVLSIGADMLSVEVFSRGLTVSASFVSIILVAVLAGATPAAIVAVLTILVSWSRERYRFDFLLINIVTYGWFPLAAGAAFSGAADVWNLESGASAFYLAVLGAFFLALTIDFLLIAGYVAYVERTRLLSRVRSALIPILPSELASSVLTVALAAAYVSLGMPALALFAAVVLIFQYLLGVALVSAERADELELRARQLAGFQVALLSALLRTLDLRDRMTARHSAAVARYAREIAAQVGLPETDQELVHSAGLLHDIGKFILPDDVLKSGRRRLTDAEWDAVKKHPAEGARIVSQIDGYEPIGEIIIAHHERMDGEGYPAGLSGEEIPVLARIVAVAETYDAMTARDTYRTPMSSFEAVTELRRVSGTQLDGRFVEALIEVLDGKGLAFRHGEDADFEAELALDARIHDYVRQAPERPVGRKQSEAPEAVSGRRTESEMPGADDRPREAEGFSQGERRAERDADTWERKAAMLEAQIREELEARIRDEVRRELEEELQRESRAGTEAMVDEMRQAFREELERHRSWSAGDQPVRGTRLGRTRDPHRDPSSRPGR